MDVSFIGCRRFNCLFNSLCAFKLSSSDRSWFCVLGMKTHNSGGGICAEHFHWLVAHNKVQIDPT